MKLENYLLKRGKLLKFPDISNRVPDLFLTQAFLPEIIHFFGILNL